LKLAVVLVYFFVFVQRIMSFCRLCKLVQNAFLVHLLFLCTVHGEFCARHCHLFSRLFWIC